MLPAPLPPCLQAPCLLPAGLPAQTCPRLQLILRADRGAGVGQGWGRTGVGGRLSCRCASCSLPPPPEYLGAVGGWAFTLHAHMEASIAEWHATQQSGNVL